jgi:AraC-like DNA-binding protein
MALLYRDIELMELMQDFYVLTGIRIALFDANGVELISYPQGEATFCHCMRKNPEFRAKCRESDENAFEKCRQTHKLHIFKCHAGLIEASVPMIEDGKVMGYMMLGRITDKKNKVELVGTVMSRCRGYGTGAEVEEMIKRIKYRNEKQIQAAAKILDACCEYVKLREMVHPSGKRLIDSVERFVEEHISEEITVERLCEEFDISRTKLYETVRPYTNGGIAAFIKHKRLEYAKNLLKTTEMSIPQVADAAGFSDYNYFLRLFKQKYGISTKQMRKEE